MLVMPLFKRLLFNCQQPEHGGLKNLANQVAILAGAGCAKNSLQGLTRTFSDVIFPTAMHQMTKF